MSTHKASSVVVAAAAADDDSGLTVAGTLAAAASKKPRLPKTFGYGPSVRKLAEIKSASLGEPLRMSTKANALLCELIVTGIKRLCRNMNRVSSNFDAYRMTSLNAAKKRLLKKKALDAEEASAATTTTTTTTTDDDGTATNVNPNKQEGGKKKKFPPSMINSRDVVSAAERLLYHHPVEVEIVKNAANAACKKLALNGNLGETLVQRSGLVIPPKRVFTTAKMYLGGRNNALDAKISLTAVVESIISLLLNNIIQETKLEKKKRISETHIARAIDNNAAFGSFFGNIILGPKIPRHEKESIAALRFQYGLPPLIDDAGIDIDEDDLLADDSDDDADDAVIDNDDEDDVAAEYYVPQITAQSIAQTKKSAAVSASKKAKPSAASAPKARKAPQKSN